MRGLATLPQANQELLIVKDNVGRPPDELGLSKCVECDAFSLRRSDAVGWVTLTGSTCSLCWFVGGDSLTGALQFLRLQLSPLTQLSFTSDKSRICRHSGTSICGLCWKRTLNECHVIVLGLNE